MGYTTGVPIAGLVSYYCILRAVNFCLQVGFSHANVLRTIIQHACLRFPSLASYERVPSMLPEARTSRSLPHTEAFPKHQDARNVYVIFGGDTSERQVSLMSGTNVWLNLQAFQDVSILIRDGLVHYGQLQACQWLHYYSERTFVEAISLG